MNDLVNLLVDLREDRFGAQAHADALRALDRAGFSLERGAPGDDAFLAWIDESFGGAWSGEAFVGKSLIARREGRFAGFATYDPRALQYAWLSGLGAQPGCGIFGPFGVTPPYRGSELGPSLLTAALASLREAGYAKALVPAVGGDRLIAYYERHAGATVAERFERAQRRSKRYRTVVMASGNGSNFQAVVDGARAGDLPLEITLLLSNSAGAFALERARRAATATALLRWERGTQTREQYDALVLEAVTREEPDLVLLLGWMHLLDDRFLQAFPQTINIHPAFLPLDQRCDEVTFADGTRTSAFRGAHAVRDALASGSRWIGASAHRVTLERDHGPVLVRKPLAVAPGENEEALLARLHPVEHLVLEQGIMRWIYEQPMPCFERTDANR